MELEIPKLSIQTLVENSIKHALEKVSSTITIDIRAELTESHAIISVRDNGPGFSRERLEQVRKSFLSEWKDRGERGREHWSCQSEYASQAALRR